MPDGSAISKKTKAGPISADRLKSFIERIEKLEEERKAIGGDIKDVYSEAKGVGYDVKTMRKVVSLRQMDAADRAEQDGVGFARELEGGLGERIACGVDRAAAHQGFFHLELEVERVEHAHGLRHDLGTDAVTRQHSNLHDHG